MTRRLPALAAPALAAVIVAVLALALRSPGAAVHAATRPAVRSGHVTVAIANYAYAPATLTVTAGTHITFVDHDNTAHTATANHGAFDTGTINPGHRRTITVSAPGTYGYHCLFHAFMTGTIKVVR